MVNFGIGLAILILIFVILFQAWQIIEQRKAHETREKALLDRIMARNYEVYVNSEIVRDQAKQPATPAFEEEHGIPVI
jgi:hypothetical protein